MFVSKGGTLTAQEVQEDRNQGQNQSATYDEVRIQIVEPPSHTVSTRTPQTCSLYRSLEHTACRCPERQ